MLTEYTLDMTSDNNKDTFLLQGRTLTVLIHAILQASNREVANTCANLLYFSKVVKQIAMPKYVEKNSKLILNPGITLIKF